MADISSIRENGLLAELAYLQLENFTGNRTNKIELIEFIDKQNKDTIKGDRLLLIQ
ncbi:hypothetical protein [Sulfurospirillum arcachonense]|uniref:hypothetical protein n=1 Tax=Sulfurospirillum arcachonense TaxID=57666 RepID=UPI0004B433C3|nr:hypothetical protein [Sulfurospirillum arcachonense]